MYSPNQLVTESNRERFKEKIVERYGLDILEELERAKENPFYKLADVARKFGFTREYARQLFDMIYPKSIRYYHKEKKEDLKAIDCPHNPFYKVAEYKPGSAKFKGAVIEKLFIEQAKNQGLRVFPCCDAKIDFSVNGHLVEVKSSYTAHLMRKGCITCYYRYGLLSEQKVKADFIACYHILRKSFFIIPIGAFKGRSIYLPEKPSSYHAARNKWMKYENAWNLLKF